MSPLPIDIYDESSKLLTKLKSYYVKETGKSYTYTNSGPVHAIYLLLYNVSVCPIYTDTCLQRLHP